MRNFRVQIRASSGIAYLSFILIFLDGDPHWKSQSFLSPFCELNYTGIATVETLTEDLPVILDELDLKMKTEGLEKIGKHATSTDESIEKTYLAKLDENLRKSLYEVIFENDYEFFSDFYKPSKHFSL